MSWKSIFLDSEHYNYEYFQDNNICRLCWSPNASSVISKDSESEVKNTLYDKIMYCLDIDVPQNSDMNKVCSNCIDKIERFYEFKLFCHETDARLQHIIQNSARDNTMEIKIENFNLDLCTEDNVTDFLDSTEIIPQVTVKQIVVNNTENISVDIQPDPDGNKLKNSKKQSNSFDKVEVSETIKLRKINRGSIAMTFCSVCHLDCENEEKFLEHNASYHGVEENGTLFKCFGCEKRFKSKKSRASHEIKFCKGLKDGYKCGICERFLPKRTMHEKHMRYHLHNRQADLPDDIFKCKKCNKRFETNESLIKHVAEHEVKKNYVCETCGRVFTRQDYLYKHTLTHAGVKRHSCPHCDFKATQRSSLTMHLRKHTGERPYSCDLCPQRCVSSSNLRAHRRRHLHIKKYECTICSKRFGYKISLEEHVSSTHERTELHPCEHCGATYSRIRGLRRHLAAKHGKQDKQETVKDKTIERSEENVSNDQQKVAIIKNLTYDLKEGDLLLIKNPDCEIFMV